MAQAVCWRDMEKWLNDAIASAKKCILNNGGQVSFIDFTELLSKRLLERQ